MALPLFPGAVAFLDAHPREPREVARLALTHLVEIDRDHGADRSESAPADCVVREEDRLYPRAGRMHAPHGIPGIDDVRRIGAGAEGRRALDALELRARVSIPDAIDLARHLPVRREERLDPGVRVHVALNPDDGSKLPPVREPRDPIPPDTAAHQVLRRSLRAAHPQEVPLPQGPTFVATDLPARICSLASEDGRDVDASGHRKIRAASVHDLPEGQ